MVFKKIAAPLLTSLGLTFVALPQIALSADSSSLSPGQPVKQNSDFKFPIVLCRFKQAMLKEQEGRLRVAVDQDFGPEYAFPVGNVRTLNTRTPSGQMSREMDGDFSGHYEIAGSSYRLTVEGSIHQAQAAGAQSSMHFRTFLEKKLAQPDATGSQWLQVGQAHNFVPAAIQPDGSVWENVYPYTFNTVEMNKYLADGKLKQDKILEGIRDGVLQKDAVFKVGPACGFLDGRTAKRVASAEDRARFAAIFDQIPDAPAETPIVTVASHAELKRPEPVEAKPETAPAAELQAEAAQGQNIAQAPQPGDAEPSLQQNAMAPNVEAELARQNQLADQAAAQYNISRQQAESGVAVQDNRDPASLAAQAPAPADIQVPVAGMPTSPEQLAGQMQALQAKREYLSNQQAQLEQQQQSLAQAQEAQLAQQQQLQAPQADGTPHQPVPQTMSAPMSMASRAGLGAGHGDPAENGGVQF